MPFLGNEPSNTFVSIAKQTITGNGGTSYALSYSVTSANDIDVFYNNVRQEPTVAYTASGTTITFTEAIASTDSVYVLFNNQAIGTINPPTGSVGVGQLNTTEVDARYVNVSGDTMTNGLTINENTFGCNVRLKNDGAGGQDWYLFSTMNAFAQGAGKLMAYNAGNAHSYDWAIDSLGRVTTPYQPVASAGWSGDVAPGNIVPANVMRLNIGSHLSASGRFTAPVAGVYFAAISCMASGSADLRVQLNKNGSSLGGDHVSYSRSSNYTKGAWMGYVSLAANDYLEFLNSSGSYAPIHTDHGHICFHLIG